MSGHIRRRGERSWELKFDLGTDPLTGKRITKYRSFKGTKREADAELRRLLGAADKGEYVDASKETVAQFLDRWERDWAAINVGPKTLERYKELLRLHVRPHVGATPIQKLQPVNLAGLYAKLLREGRGEGKGLSARTVGHVHRVIHKALAVAAEWGIVQRNVADVAKPPKVQGAEIEIISDEQVRDVLQKLRGHPFYTVAALGLGTGMRRGELLALRWKDVDLDGAKLRVEQSLEQTKPRPDSDDPLAKRGLRFKAPKTKHGRRQIALPPSIVAELRAHWKGQQEHRLKLGLGKASDDALVFPSLEGGPRSPNAVTKEWERLVSTLKLPPVSLHALRHTHASQLIASGMDVLTISRRLGHASPTITLGVYGHLFSNTDDRAAQVIEAAFAQAMLTE